MDYCDQKAIAALVFPNSLDEETSGYILQPNGTNITVSEEYLSSEAEDVEDDRVSVTFVWFCTISVFICIYLSPLDFDTNYVI